MVMLFAGSSFAFTPPPAPQSGWYVSDQTGKLTQEQIASLNQKIDQVSKSTKNEFGILFLNTMDGDNIEDVAYTTFNSWGIGKRGLDNGCLIVVSLTERKSRIETGKGVGGEVTDIQALDILKTKLNPHLKTGDFAGGFHATLDALSALIESRHNKTALVVTEPTPSASTSCSLVAGVGAGSENVSSTPFLLFLLAASGFVAILLIRRNARRKQKAIDDAAEEAELEYIDNEHEACLEKEVSDRAAIALNNQRIKNDRKAVMIPPAPAPRRVAPPIPRPTVNTVKAATTAAVAAGVTAGVLAAAAEKRLKDQKDQEEPARRKRQEDNRRRQQEDDDRRRRDDDEDRRSSSSSDFGSSSGSDYSSGGGFDGGSSGGGGGSSDW